MSLEEIIIQQIDKEGPISFRDFMELSLYHPDFGYYTSVKDTIGKHGDYYTSSNLTSAFGAVIARQVKQMWQLSGEETFTIVEYGAGTGLLCYDILEYFKKYTGVYEKLNYYIIEKSGVMREWQKKRLNESVRWFDAASDIGEITGCVLSNELVDNFSVHRVIMEDELMEVFVDYQNEFVEVLMPAGEMLKNYFAALNVNLPWGFKTEINLEAIEWIKEISTCIKKGYMITIDYGNDSSELYSPRKSCGTLVCYNKHQVIDNPYYQIGKQDITAHVNFSALIHWGSKYGLECLGYTDQAHFLLSLGFKEQLRTIVALDQLDLLSMVKKEALITHRLLVDMGSKFKVLLQSKGMPNHALLGLNMSI